SKMGISTVDGYRGAQIFEALGLAAEVIDTCLVGTASVVGGLGFAALGDDVLRRHRDAFGADEPDLDSPGFVRFRKGGEYHASHPDAIEALHVAVGLGKDKAAAHVLQQAVADGRADLYARFAELVNSRPTIPIEDDEPALAITRRFSSGAMSHGSLSAEAHETLALALNAVGARNN